MEFWEENFIDKQEMWGFMPAKSAELTKNFFVEENIKKILVPGFGYGRNAKIFSDEGIQITGIEISKTAIALSKKHYGNEIKVFHGSVTDMPFDTVKYEGIFSYALIHLLDEQDRIKLIEDCYNQLTEGGFMVFTAITKEAPNFGKGKFISEDRYEFHRGAKIFYYDRNSVQTEFGEFGLFEIIEVNENQPMYLIKCRKK